MCCFTKHKEPVVFKAWLPCTTESQVIQVILQAVVALLPSIADIAKLGCCVQFMECFIHTKEHSIYFLCSHSFSIARLNFWLSSVNTTLVHDLISPQMKNRTHKSLPRADQFYERKFFCRLMQLKVRWISLFYAAIASPVNDPQLCCARCSHLQLIFTRRGFMTILSSNLVLSDCKVISFFSGTTWHSAFFPAQF